MARSDKNSVTNTAASWETHNAMPAEGNSRTHLMYESSASELTALPDQGCAQPADALLETFQPVRMEAKLRAKELEAAIEPLRATQADLAARFAALETRMTRQTVQQAEDARDMDSILHAITRGQSLEKSIPHLLRYRSVSGGKPVCRKISLDVSVAAVVGRRLGTIADRRAEVHWDGPLPFVVADSALLQEVLGHLLDNALMYVAPQVMPRVRLWTEKKESAVRLYIEDNGVGVIAKDHERIFRLFERAASDQPGAGIGLAIVRRAMSQMNGSAGVQSKPGAGSRFWIELPAAQ